MKRNLIRPTTQRLSTSPVNKEQTISLTLDMLLERFRLNVAEGKIEIKSIHDFTKVVNTMLMVDERISISKEAETSAYEHKIHDIIDEDNPKVQELYNMLFEAYNEGNDERNR